MLQSNWLKDTYRLCLRFSSALVCVLAVVFAAAASAQDRPPAYVGTWKCVDAVDDNDRPYSITIKRIGDGYELDDPSEKPSRTVGGRVSRGKLTFAHKTKSGSAPLVFTLDGHGERMTEQYSSGGKQLAIHFTRASHRK